MKNKKTLIMAISVFLLVAASAIFAGFVSGRGRYQKNANSQPVYNGEQEQFIVPQDAQKTGEVAMIVDDIESARQNILAIANKNQGSIYQTYISYESGQIKNGWIVIQLPVENFDRAFEQMKGISSQIVEESSKQIQQAYYPIAQPNLDNGLATIQSQPANVENASKQELKDDHAEAVGSQDATGSTDAQFAIYRRPAFLAQNKSYVRVVFVDYNNDISGPTEEDYFINNQALPNIWVFVVVKLMLLVVLIGLLIFLMKRTFGVFHSHRKSKHAPIVRQAQKSRDRVIRIAKRK